MSRDEAIAVVEAYLKGLAKKDLSNVPFAPDITFEGPRVPKLMGRERVVGFLTSILPLVRRIHIQQHLVEGEFVATMDPDASWARAPEDANSIARASNSETTC